MSVLLSTFAPLLAQEAPATAPAGSGPFGTVVMVFVLLIVMWLLFVLPKRSQDKQAKKMIDSLKVNDKVMTTSGIIGTIYSVDKEGGEVVLKVDDANNVKIRFSIGAIYFVFNKDGAKDAKSAKK